MIDEYNFGNMVIDGVSFTSDLIIFPNMINDNWWRREGHNLNLEDLKEVLEFKPEILIIGTGFNGRMNVSEQVKKQIENDKITVFIETTKEAYKRFNKLSKEKKVVGVFHLTC